MPIFTASGLLVPMPPAIRNVAPNRAAWDRGASPLRPPPDAGTRCAAASHTDGSRRSPPPARARATRSRLLLTASRRIRLLSRPAPLRGRAPTSAAFPPPTRRRTSRPPAPRCARPARAPDPREDSALAGAVGVRAFPMQGAHRTAGQQGDLDGARAAACAPGAPARDRAPRTTVAMRRAASAPGRPPASARRAGSSSGSSNSGPNSARR